VLDAIANAEPFYIFCGYSSVDARVPSGAVFHIVEPDGCYIGRDGSLNDKAKLAVNASLGTGPDFPMRVEEFISGTQR
jgi:hypothetical protein